MTDQPQTGFEIDSESYLRFSSDRLRFGDGIQPAEERTLELDFSFQVHADDYVIATASIYQKYDGSDDDAPLAGYYQSSTPISKEISLEMLSNRGKPEVSPAALHASMQRIWEDRDYGHMNEILAGLLTQAVGEMCGDSFAELELVEGGVMMTVHIRKPGASEDLAAVGFLVEEQDLTELLKISRPTAA